MNMGTLHYLRQAHALAAINADESAVNELTVLINAWEEGVFNAENAKNTPSDDTAENAKNTPSDAPRDPAYYKAGAESWDDITVPHLEAEVMHRRITIMNGSGEGGRIVRADLLTALIEDDDAREQAPGEGGN